jgi:hypothetical protein
MTTFDASMKGAMKAMDDARETAGRTGHRARSALVDGLQAAASTVAMLRGLGLVDALGRLGLQHRRGPVLPVVYIGTGFLAGLATGFLAAPLSGAEARRWIVERTVSLGRNSKEAAARSANDKAAAVVSKAVR